LEIPEQYLGSAEAFRKALASEADRENAGCQDNNRRGADRQDNDKEQ
jgi:hypothetical protein